MLLIVLNQVFQIYLQKLKNKIKKKPQTTIKEDQFNENLRSLKTWTDLGLCVRWYLLVHLSLNHIHILTKF